MDEKLTLICDNCKLEMREIEAEFTYLNHSFRHKVMRCPNCGQVCLSEDLVSGRMKEIETLMEDK
jgi:uncharacterized Zn finger protein